MAFVEHLSSGRTYRLSSHCVIGRAPTCAVRLTSDLTSNLHAAIRWNGSGWELRDLGSVNGTFVDDEPIEMAGSRPIVTGTRIAFGDKHDVFQVTDDAPPVAMATSSDGRVVAATNGFLLLPDEDNPMYQVFHDTSNRWVAESTEGHRLALVDGGTLSIGNVLWTLELPMITKGTVPRGMSLESLTLRLWKSRHGEHFEAEICQGSSSKRLESRAHVELLYHLARARLKDQRRRSQRSEREHGWVAVDLLLHELKVSRNWIDVSVFRARQQLADAGVRGADRLFERRRDSGEIRLNIERIEIVQS